MRRIVALESIGGASGSSDGRAAEAKEKWREEVREDERLAGDLQRAVAKR
jgi:hypothetical protein